MFDRRFFRSAFYQVWLTIILVLLVALTIECAVTGAQQPPASTQATSGSNSTSQTVDSAPFDSDQKARIIASDRWKRVEQDFHQWLAVQVVLTPEQVDQMKAKLRAQIRNMSNAELAQFLDQWDAKLKVLLGRDAAEARQWLGEYLSVIADGYRQQFLQRLGTTDVTNLTAAQIEDVLDRLRADRLEFQEQRAFFDVSRQLSVQRAQQWQSATNASLQKTGQRNAAQFNSHLPPPSPRQYNFQPRPPLIPFFW